MKVLHTSTETTTQENAIERLENYLARLRAREISLADLEAFEKEVHEVVMAVEREIVAEGLSQLDIGLPFIEMEGKVYRPVMRSEVAYLGAAGPMRVKRTLYSTRELGARSVCPLEWRAGIVGGLWTPLAARQGVWATAHMTPQEAEGLFQQLGNMTPSKSSLDRLAKLLNEPWEENREDFETVLRAQTSIPKEAVVVGVSLDGVMAPMKEGQRQEKRDQAKVAGKLTSGPAGYQEVGCGTVSFYDGEGERLASLRMARMPESNKKTLKSTLRAEIAHILEQRTDLRLVKLADGAKDNWTFLSNALPEGKELLDFYHAAGHLKIAFDVAYHEDSPKAQAQFKKYRHLLLEDENGPAKVIRALDYLHKKHPRRKKLKTELKYFRRNRHRMGYAQAKTEKLPIGSGVVEAACKTLVTQRLKRSGMRWRHRGAQAILTFRSLIQSGRFERGWQLLAKTFKREIIMPHNVVLFSG